MRTAPLAEPLASLPMRSARATLLATAVLGLAPALAHAQSAGDNQYTDPFGSSTTPTQPSTTHHTSTTTHHQSLTPTPPPSTNVAPATATNAPATPQPTPTTQAGTTASDPAATTLPRTGTNTLEELALGAALLLTGAAITARRRTRAR